MDQAKAALRMARIIAASLPTGVALFWAVAWVVTKSGSVGVAPQALGADPALWLWSAVALAGFAGALLFRGRASEIAERAASRPWSAQSAAQVQTNLLVAWALLEAPALLSGVFFLLLATPRLLWGAVPVYLLGVAVTFPRPEWFGAAGDGPS